MSEGLRCAAATETGDRSHRRGPPSVATRARKSITTIVLTLAIGTQHPNHGYLSLRELKP
ncbi:hypothetical protein HPG69_009065 [Diceros bicornis minor]|uniref:Uncharacterized protein n=1 Tax=Diceros bicornis minor TaxID=77932 RepID=A0A7J7EBY6_DICBM|nr:hypothetical protein HPG69_009065 [Diceros bicornis minor]